MNPSSSKEAETLLRGVIHLSSPRFSILPKVIILPPFLFLSNLKTIPLPQGFFLGAQNVFWEDIGAFTGETSPLQLRSAGAKYVLIGHSERRGLGETDEMVAKKILSAVKNGLTPILCVGEDRSIRKKGLAAAKKFVGGEIKKALKNLPAAKADGEFLVVYEPVWAISSVSGGKSDSPDSAAEMLVFIKKTLGNRLKNLKILYGGSVNAKNAGEFLNRPDIDGALVGGASLRADEFAEIIKMAV